MENNKPIYSIITHQFKQDKFIYKIARTLSTFIFYLINLYKVLKGHESTIFHTFREMLEPVDCVYEEGTHGTILFDLKFSNAAANAFFMVFGGAIGYIVDNINLYFYMDVISMSTTDAFTSQRCVTLKMNIDYLNGIKFGQDLIVSVQTVTKLTKKLAFVLITLEDKSTRTALAQASSVMMISQECILIFKITDNSRNALVKGSGAEFKSNTEMPKL